jgi:ABC-type transport system substrate-binding protein
MNNFPSSRPGLALGRWSFLVTLLILGGGWALSQASPQKDQKPPPIEEVDPNAKPLRKPPREEEVLELADLAHEVERATHPELQELYRRLAYPHDVVTLRNGETRKVVPLLVYIGPGSGTTSSVALKPLDDKWKLGASFTVPRRNIESVDYYEQIALTQVDKFLKGQFAVPGTVAAKPLTRQERLEGAEKVLAAVLNFHKPAPDRYARGSSVWKDLEQRLRDKLLDVRLEHLHLLISSNAWEDALVRGEHLAQFEYKTDAKVHLRIAKELVELVAKSLKEGKYEEVQQRLSVLEKLPDSGPATEPISKELRDKATQKFRDAEQAKAKNDLVGANTLVNEAERLWPRLNGVNEFRLQLNRDHPTLWVGVHELPEFFSPATAVTDTEKQAVELLFDSLLKLHDEPNRGQTYEPSLALAAPRRTSQGWQFQLDRTAYWSTDNPVTEADVRLTVRRLGKSGWPGFAPAWADLVETPTGGQEPGQVSLMLRQGFLDPFSLMTFKILPASVSLKHPADPQFGRNPVGSGPYQLVDVKRREADFQANAVVFVARSSYHRTRRAEQPCIPEIRFVKSSDPIVDFKGGQLHLLLDLWPQRIAALRARDDLAGLIQIQALKNRRIYFLAVNHRVPSLRNKELRKAIAHAINRNQILDGVFREDLPSGFSPPHRPLSGPYPPGSWAYAPGLREDPYQPERAKQLAAEAKKTVADVKLTLKYPADDRLVARACAQIQEQVQAATGFDIELEARPPRDLHHEVEDLNSYELAYYSYDYPSEAYWIWPLFNNGTPETGSRNYLGYQNDGALEEDCQRAMSHREFAKVQEYTHSIHKQIYEKMPFIPLWQLDTFLAIHKDLKPVHLDPLLIFPDVEQWTLEKK